jgi:hypothetical protein
VQPTNEAIDCQVITSIRAKSLEVVLNVECARTIASRIIGGNRISYASCDSITGSGIARRVGQHVARV